MSDHANMRQHVRQLASSLAHLRGSADQECLSSHAIEYASQVFVSTDIRACIRARMYLVRVRVNERTSARVCGQERHKEWLCEWHVRGRECDEGL